MKFLSTEKISEHKRKTPEGYLICIDSILARTGKQTYTRNEVFHDDSEEEIEIDRTEDEVFSPQTLASFENKPLTVEHPDEDVNSENWKDYQVGFVRDIKRGKGENGEDVMLGTLVIQDAQTIKEIEAGEHTQLSCGYDCDVTDDNHPRQVRIRGNHVALCQQGRAGIARIVDSVKDRATTEDLFKGFGGRHFINFQGNVEVDQNYSDDFEDWCKNRGIKLNRLDHSTYGFQAYEVTDSIKDDYDYIKGFVFSDWDGDVKGKFDGFYNPKEVETILNNFIVYTKNRGHADLNGFNLKNNDGFAITFDGGTVYIDFLTTRYQSEKQEIAKMAKKYFGTNNIKFTDSIKDDDLSYVIIGKDKEWDEYYWTGSNFAPADYMMKKYKSLEEARQHLNKARSTKPDFDLKMEQVYIQELNGKTWTGKTFDSDEGPTETHKFEVGFVDQNDHSDYVDIKASSAEEAIKIVKNTYHPYRVFHVRQVDSVKGSKTRGFYRDSRLWTLVADDGRYVTESGRLSNPIQWGAIPKAFDTEQEAFDFLKTHSFPVSLYPKSISYSQYQNGTVDSMKDARPKAGDKYTKRGSSDWIHIDLIHPNGYVSYSLWQPGKPQQARTKSPDEFERMISGEGFIKDSCVKDAIEIKPGQYWKLKSYHNDVVKIVQVDEPSDSLMIEDVDGEVERFSLSSFRSDAKYNTFVLVSQSEFTSAKQKHSTNDSKPYILIQKINGKEFKLCDAIAESGEKALQQFRTNNPQFENRPLKAILKSAYRDAKLKDFDDTPENINVVREFFKTHGNTFNVKKDAYQLLEYIHKKTGVYNADFGDVLDIIEEYTRVNVIDSKLMKTKDGKETFTISWIDNTSKSEGYPREFWKHEDQFKVNSAHEALEQLAKHVGLSGIGTYNATINSMRSDSKQYFYYGRLSELLNRVKDSKK